MCQFCAVYQVPIFTSAHDKTKLNNDFGMLFTALSRAKDPTNNTLIEKFPADMLDKIANSDAMNAMKTEFDELNKKYNIKANLFFHKTR